MSVEHTEPAVHRQIGEHVLYKCRRCGKCIPEGPHDDVRTALRRALEHAPTIVHECSPAWPSKDQRGGGAWGIADVVGTSERPKEEATT